jgi:hypothetical protein
MIRWVLPIVQRDAERTRKLNYVLRFFHFAETQGSRVPRPYSGFRRGFISVLVLSFLLGSPQKGDDAFNSRDFAGMKATTHHPEMIAHVPGSAEPIHGQPAHAEMIGGMFRMFPDVHVYNDPYPIQLGSGDWITVITRATGTFTGEMILPDGKVIAPTGKAFDLTFATTAKWDGDLLIEEFVSWGLRSLQAQQIGLA